MLDIKFIRTHKDIVAAGAAKKHVDVDIDALIELDDSRLSLLQAVEELRAQQNEASKKIAQADDAERSALISDMQTVKEDLRVKEEELKTVETRWNSLMLQVPNVPEMSVPEGKDDADNVMVHEWGTKPEFDFTPKDHIEIMRDLDMVDLERGAKVHGFRGYFLKNMGMQLSFAIWQYAFDFFGKQGFTPFLAPAIVRPQYFYGTGHLPGDANDLYVTQDEDYLAGTAEVPMMAYHADEVLDQSELEKKYLAFSPCYRREAGSYSKDTKGLIRVHEFYKVEQVVLCEANHATSVAWHEQLNRNAEEFIESLGIPYRTVLNCGGDLGLGQVKKYDIELWVPGEKKYREISSASYFHDFQTRRFNIRYKDKDGKLHFAHSLNCTAAPTPRILVSMVENFQTKDGSVTIPKVLQPYLGGKELITPPAN
jgi:seryl-tRNA synthetase